jgi:hypothetical protein
MFTLKTSFQTTFALGKGGNPLLEVTVNSKGGKLLRFLSQLRPRIRPLVSGAGAQTLRHFQPQNPTLENLARRLPVRRL